MESENKSEKVRTSGEVWPPEVERSGISQREETNETPSALPLVVCGEAIYVVGILFAIIFRNPVPVVYTKILSFIAGFIGFLFGLAELRWPASRTALALAIILLFVNAFTNANVLNN